jgi:hypothetical protein
MSWFSQLYSWIVNLFRKLTPASNLSSTWIKTIENNMERYRFSWVPSTSKSASSQDVMITFGGYTYTANTSPLPMSVSSIAYDVQSGVPIEFVVKTANSDRTLFSSSDRFSFTSYIKPPDPLTPATGLAATWIQTV